MLRKLPLFVIVLLWCCTQLCCSLFGRLALTRIDIPSSFFGVTHAGYSRSTTEYSLLKTMGSKMSRIDFSWNVIEANQGVFDFSVYDAFVDTALSNGVDVLAILDYDVSWIHSNGQEQKYVPPDRMPDWLDYVGKVVDRYRGKVKAYEIWNEPNGVFWSGSKSEFSELTRQTAALIRVTDPSATIVAGSFSRDPRDWFRTMQAAGALENADAVSFHPYAPTAESVFQMSVAFMNDMRGWGYVGKFWITEIGFTTQGIYPWTIHQEEYPSQLVKTMTLLSVTGADKVVWYTLTDKYLANQPPVGETIVTIAEAYFGVAYPDYSPKNGAYAYQAISNVVQGSTYVPDIVENNSELGWICVFPFSMADGRLGVVAWSNLPARIEFSETFNATMPSISGPGLNGFSGQRLRLSSQPLVLVSANAVDLSTPRHLLIHKAAF